MIKEKALVSILNNATKQPLSDTLVAMYKKGCDKVWFNGFLQNTSDVINDIDVFGCDYIVTDYFLDYNQKRAIINLEGNVALLCNFRKGV